MENFELIKDPEHTLKLCTKCGELKSVVPNFSIYFRKDRNRRTISSFCKSCAAKNTYNYTQQNKDKVEFKEKRKKLDKKRTLSGINSTLAKDRYKKYKKIVFDNYGNVCSCCGETEIAFLTIEHTLHNGKQHRVSKKSAIYKDIIDKGFPSDLTLFCSNCNFATRYGQPCPHQVKNHKNNLLIFNKKE